MSIPTSITTTLTTVNKPISVSVGVQGAEKKLRVPSAPHGP